MTDPSGMACAGEKLIEHLKNWLEPEKLVRPDCAWAPGEAPTVAAAILNLFHLLPRQAVQFLETKGAQPSPADFQSLPVSLGANLGCGHHFSQDSSLALAQLRH